MKIAAFLNNVVPYHRARWKAAARMTHSCDLLEITNRDEFCVLEGTESGDPAYRLHTLFPGRERSELGTSEIKKSVELWLERERPDLLVLNGWSFSYNLVALRWALKHGVPCVMCSESNEFDEPRSALKEFIKGRIVSLCSAGLAGGTPQADYLVKLGLPRVSVSTGYDAVDNDYFQMKRVNQDEKELPVRYFFSCARFGKKKNLPGLIRAYARYRMMIIETASDDLLCDLVIAGEGEERPVIEKAIRDSGTTAHVHLLGPQGYAELPAYYAKAAAFIHVSTTEQWGLVVNEAMASALPVLVSNRCGCAADLVKEGENGWTFDPADETALALFMAKISANEATRLTMGQKSLEIIKDWGPERFANGLCSAIKAAQAAPMPRLKFLDSVILWILTRH